MSAPSGQAPMARKPRLIKTAAVVLSCEPNTDGLTVAQAMIAAKASISLAEVGVSDVRPRMALNGGLMLEISGEGREAKADVLAEKIRGVLAGPDGGVEGGRPGLVSYRSGATGSECSCRGM